MTGKLQKLGMLGGQKILRKARWTTGGNRVELKKKDSDGRLGLAYYWEIPNEIKSPRNREWTWQYNKSEAWIRKQSQKKIQGLQRVQVWSMWV